MCERGYVWLRFFFFFFKQKTAYEILRSDWSSDVCSSDLPAADVAPGPETVELDSSTVDRLAIARHEQGLRRSHVDRLELGEQRSQPAWIDSDVVVEHDHDRCLPIEARTDADVRARSEAVVGLVEDRDGGVEQTAAAERLGRCATVVDDR